MSQEQIKETEALKHLLYLYHIVDLGAKDILTLCIYFKIMFLTYTK